MDKIIFSFENGKLGIDFPNELRGVFLSGESKKDLFRVKTEYFETYSGLSDDDRSRIRQAIKNRNNKGLKPMIVIN